MLKLEYQNWGYVRSLIVGSPGESLDGGDVRGTCDPITSLVGYDMMVFSQCDHIVMY